MLKLLLLSIVLASLVIPALAARAVNGSRALRSVLLALFLVEVCYGAFLIFVYQRLM